MSSGRATSRHRSREVALQVLYAVDVGRGGEGDARAQVEAAFARAADHFELPEGARAFAKELLCGVAAHRSELDALIDLQAEHWRLERMAAVDRNILRLAAYEICHTATPAAVVIDEAVNLARRFGGERSPEFVNGILDAIARRRAREPG